MQVPAGSVERWTNMAIKHWREFQPRRYARLRRQKKLLTEAGAAAELTAAAMAPLLAAGAREDEAWEEVRELYILLPEERGASTEEELPTSIAYSAMSEFIRDLQRDNDDD